MLDSIKSMKRFGLTIAAIIRNEGPYLAEWIEYHSLIGFEHIYLYDNGSSDETMDVICPYIIQGRVTLLSWPEFPGQISAYNHALKIFGRDTEWMALIDPDEFIQVEQGGTLRAVLASLGAADQILLPWMHFDSAGHEEVPDALVIESYTRRAETAHRQPKPIVRPEAVLWAEVHHCVTRHCRTVDSSGMSLPEQWILDHPPGGPLRLNHYFTKSRAEFAAKIARGQVDGGRGKTMEAFTRFNCPIEDKSLATMGSAVREALRETASRSTRPVVHAPWSAQSEISASRAWTLKARAALRGLRTHLGPEAITSSRSEIEWEQLTLQPLSLSSFSQAFGALREGMAERVADGVVIGAWRAVHPIQLGRPYLAIAVQCATETQLEVTVRGEDAGRKPFASETSIALPAGDSVTFAILSERTMNLERVLIKSDKPLAIHEA